MRKNLLRNIRKASGVAVLTISAFYMKYKRQSVVKIAIIVRNPTELYSGNLALTTKE